MPAHDQQDAGDLSLPEQGALRKMRERGTPLAEWDEPIAGDARSYVWAVLGSALGTWFTTRADARAGRPAADSAEASAGGVPVPRIGGVERRPFVELAERIRIARDADAHAEATEWERALDRLVYDLYGLTEDEDAAVERALLHRLVRAHRAALAQQGVDQGRLAVIDMGDDGDVAQVHGCAALLMKAVGRTAAGILLASTGVQ